MKLKLGNSLIRSPALVFLLPMLIYIAVWRFFPLLYTMFLSLQSWNLVYRQQPTFFGFGNYLNLLTDARFHNSLFVSFFFMIGATAIEVFIGTFMAVVMDDLIRGRGVLRGILILPMFLNPVAVGTIWYILFEPSIGPLNYFFQTLGMAKSNWLGSTNTALWAITVADVWQWAPFVFLIALAAIQGIDQNLYEAAMIDGAGYGRILVSITLPCIRGAIFVAGLLRAMDAFRIFETIYIMTGGGPGQSTESASIYVLATAFRYFEAGYGASMTVVMLVLLMIVYTVYLRWKERFA